MARTWRRGKFLGLAVLVLAAGATGGCNFGSPDAQAADGRRVETYRIIPESFLLLSDVDGPSVEVDGDATVYTIETTTDLRFTPVGESEITFSLDPDDVVIERPVAGILTLIRER